MAPPQNADKPVPKPRTGRTPKTEKSPTATNQNDTNSEDQHMEQQHQQINVTPCPCETQVTNKFTPNTPQEDKGHQDNTGCTNYRHYSYQDKP